MKEKIIVILISILLTISSILVSSKYSIYLKILGYATLIIYLIIRIIQKKPIKIIKSNLDICIIILIIDTMIPILSNTYISLYGTVETIMQYIYVLSIYIIIREITPEIKKINKIISNTLIVTAIIIILIGIDGITSNNLSNILKAIGIENVLNGENRLISIFGYPNTLAVYIASILFLNINEYLKQDNKLLKAIYKTITFVFIISIILTYSKGVILLLPIILLIYILKIKEKSKKIEIIENILISTICAIIYVTLFEKLDNNLLAWIILIISILIDFLINFIIEKSNIRIERYIIITLIIVGITGGMYVLIASKIYEEYEAFSGSTQSNYNAKVINNISGGTKYRIEFNIESKSPRDIEDTYNINIIERDSRNKEITNSEISFGTYNGIKVMEIITNEKTAEIKIEFYSKYKYVEQSLIIKSLKLNEKEIPLEYKYLPTKLIEKIKNININYKTAQERIETIKDALKLSKDNLLTGIGGTGWRYKYKEVQEYNYDVQRVHSYPAKVILEFGIFGIIAYIGIAIIIIRLLIKSKDIETISILTALIMLITHSIIDVDMEYTHILLYFFVLMSIISKNLKEKNQKGSNILNFVLIGILTINIYLTINSNLYNKQMRISELKNSINGLNVNSTQYKDISYEIAKQYEEISKYEKYDYIEMYYNIIKYYINSDCEELESILNKYYEKIVEYKNKNKNDINSIMNKIRTINNIIQELEDKNNSRYNEIIDQFAKLVLNEYEETMQILGQCLLKQYIDINDNQYTEELTQIYENMKLIKNKYILGVEIINKAQIEITEASLENIELENSKKILIYHTHGSESYKASTQYETYKFYRSFDENFNVIKIGKYLEKLLSEKGFNIEHDIEYYDIPDINDAYNKSRTEVKKILSDDTNINMIFDIHRDAISDEEHEATSIKINEEEVAQLRFVIGIKNNDNWKNNLKLAIEIQKIADKLYPGLFKPILIRERDYNQDLSKNAMLIEVGENCNTIEQALNSIKYFSEIFMNEQKSNN